MNYRRFGRTNWEVSEIGYGMWGMVGWTGSELNEVKKALEKSVELGCNFYDTAWAYAAGESEKLLGELLRKFPDKNLYYGTKIPPKNLKWPSKKTYKLDECFPKSHIIEYTEKSLKNIKTDCLELQQFHVWEDSWADNDEWKEAILQLKKDGKVKFFGVSVNRWEPNNVLNTLKTGFIDTVQVIYNIFDQAPDDELFPLCKELNVGTIARVPFDEGTLTGTLTLDTKFDPNDWRASYFVPENLKSSVEHAEMIKKIIPEGMSMPEVALKFILQNDEVDTVIPGMRKINHVISNMKVSDEAPLNINLYNQLKAQRWDRTPTEWSQ